MDLAPLTTRVTMASYTRKMMTAAAATKPKNKFNKFGAFVLILFMMLLSWFLLVRSVQGLTETLPLVWNKSKTLHH